MSTTTTLMTFEEFEKLPNMPGKQELIDGELITMPPPEDLHSLTAVRVLQFLLTVLPAGRIRADHTGYRIAGGWLEPDASVTWPDQPKDQKYLLGAPMIAVEILSPGEEIERKLTLYFNEGALEVWVIDLRHKSMTVYRREGERVVRLPVNTEYCSDAAQTTVSLSELFASQ